MYKEFTKEEFFSAFPEKSILSLFRTAVSEFQKSPQFKSYVEGKRIDNLSAFDFSNCGYKTVFLELSSLKPADILNFNGVVISTKGALPFDIYYFAVSDEEMPDELLDRINSIKKEYKASIKIGNEEYKNLN